MTLLGVLRKEEGLPALWVETEERFLLGLFHGWFMSKRNTAKTVFPVQLVHRYSGLPSLSSLFSSAEIMPTT